MDKFMNNKWFMRIVALLIALMLFMSVSFETQPKSTSPSGLPTLTSTYVETLTDVPVTTLVNAEEYVVSGVPNSVNAVLEGPTLVTKTAALQQNIEVYADLTGLGVGTHKVDLHYRNISEKINVKVEPATITVVIKEKVTVDLPVDVDFLNKDELEDGYIAEEPIIKPNVVKITGAKEDIDQIVLVKALVDLKNVSESMVQEARVAVYDKNQNALPVTVEPSIVEITVPISTPSKKVPFNIKRDGNLKEGLSILSMEVIPNEVTIFGPKEIIDSIDFIDGVTVDLSEITEDTTLEVDIPLPKGIEKISPKKIKIAIDIENAETRSLLNLPIQSFGLASGLSLNFLNPETGTLDIDVIGAPSILNTINPTDIELYINLTNLGVGEHKANIEVNGPRNLSWILPEKNVKISISENE